MTTYVSPHPAPIVSVVVLLAATDCAVDSSIPISLLEYHYMAWKVSVLMSVPSSNSVSQIHYVSHSRLFLIIL
jgi:hypothetical protein